MPTKADLAGIYHEQLVQGNRNKYCQEMFSRIGKKELFTLGQRALAGAILAELTRKDELSSSDIATIHQKLVRSESVRDTMIDDIVYVADTLRHDGYVIQCAGGHIKFASNILRDHWRHRTA